MKLIRKQELLILLGFWSAIQNVVWNFKEKETYKKINQTIFKYIISLN